MSKDILDVTRSVRRVMETWGVHPNSIFIKKYKNGGSTSPFLCTVRCYWSLLPVRGTDERTEFDGQLENLKTQFPEFDIEILATDGIQDRRFGAFIVRIQYK